MNSRKTSISYDLVDNGMIEFFNNSMASHEVGSLIDIYVSWFPPTGNHAYITKIWQDGIFDYDSISRICSHCNVEQSWMCDQVLLLASFLHTGYGIDL